MKRDRAQEWGSNGKEGKTTYQKMIYRSSKPQYPLFLLEPINITNFLFVLELLWNLQI